MALGRFSNVLRFRTRDGVVSAVSIDARTILGRPVAHWQSKMYSGFIDRLWLRGKIAREQLFGCGEDVQLIAFEKEEAVAALPLGDLTTEHLASEA